MIPPTAGPYITIIWASSMPTRLRVFYCLFLLFTHCLRFSTTSVTGLFGRACIGFIRDVCGSRPWVDGLSGFDSLHANDSIPPTFTFLLLLLHASAAITCLGAGLYVLFRAGLLFHLHMYFYGRWPLRGARVDEYGIVQKHFRYHKHQTS